VDEQTFIREIRGFSVVFGSAAVEAHGAWQDYPKGRGPFSTTFFWEIFWFNFARCP
jgi:hypothetical protein